ncbi:MAG: 2-aminoethylphosphonate--pyruvate transaminase [Rhodospirillales bacterium]|nr:2-aminoethylphosphonate--pyruvate transaminase [Rhodospirillales bacterium]
MPDPYLLTPGPLTTSATVRQAMLHDWGSRDAAFVAMNRRVRERLVSLAGGEGTHVCVPVQGSGTFAVEAAIGTLVPRAGKLLVLVNGAYGRRMVQIARVIGRACASIETAEDTPVSPDGLDRALAADGAISHVAVVHCETTSGILNPVEAVASVCARHGRRLLIDAMSAFGALPLDARETAFDAVMASANKCLEGVPGMGFVIMRRSSLAAAEGNAHSLSLDLFAQWRGFEQNEQWRFTPPTHVVAAFDQALDEHAAEGGVAGRGARYRRNMQILLDGMSKFGFVSLLPAALQAPIIATFRMPADRNFTFDVFYDGLRRRGYVIYPGKLTVAESFRVGCIGRLGETEIRGALAAVGEVLAEMGVRSGAPHQPEGMVA